MTEPQWRTEHVVRTVDLVGAPVEIVVGLISRWSSDLVPALRINDGPTVVLPTAAAHELIVVLRQTLEESYVGPGGA